jgi:D-psicose/D-tagatose/L-ribulose 3-epimerase
MAALELGLISSAWGDTHVGLEEGIRKAKEIGFDTYDIFEDPLDIDDATRELIRSTAKEVGLPIRSCVCVNFPLVDFNPSVQRFALDRTRAYIKQAAFFGARNVLVVIGEYYWDGEVFGNSDIWNIAVANLRTLAADADEAGVDLVIELEPFTQALVKDSSELARFIREVDHPRVLANADISHLHLAGNSFDDVRNDLSGIIGHIHLSDCDGKVHGDLPPGRGVTPIRDYLKAIVDSGYDTGTVSIELEYSPDPEAIVEWVEEAYRETAKIMADLGVRTANGSRAPS